MKKVFVIVLILVELAWLVSTLTSCSKERVSCSMLIATQVNSASGTATSDTTHGYNCGFIYDNPVPAPRVLNDSITIYYTVKK